MKCPNSIPLSRDYWSLSHEVAGIVVPRQYWVCDQVVAAVTELLVVHLGVVHVATHSYNLLTI